MVACAICCGGVEVVSDFGVVVLLSGVVLLGAVVVSVVELLLDPLL